MSPSQSEFDSEADHLFELFLQEDPEITGRLLNPEKQKKVFQNFDPEATEEELEIYIREANADEEGLNFLDMYDWWLQSKKTPESLVAQKGHVRN